MKVGTEAILRRYYEKEPTIAAEKESLEKAIGILVDSFQKGGKLLICGNGGSCADADHIVGELVKAFRIKRPLDADLADTLCAQSPESASMAENLQGSLPAINLGTHAALMTAMENDVGGEYIFAQQVVAYGQPEDVFLGISTSGNSKNVLLAGEIAKAKRLTTIGLVGRTGGKMKERFDLAICADADCTEDAQDLHSKMYHAICAAVEYEFWGE